MTYNLMTITYLCILALVASCSGNAKSNSNGRLSENDPPALFERGRILQGIDPNWSVVATSITPSEDLVDVQLIDHKFGKAVGAKGTIFETLDGGQSWHRLPGGLPTHPDLVRIWFVNKSLGWAVIMSRSSTLTAREQYDGFLMRTEDGGKTWSVQYKAKNGALNHVRFVNDHEGWAVGRKRRLENDEETEQPLVLHTVDQGLHWTDSFKQTTEGDSGDSVEDIHVETSSKATFLTGNGTIFTTEDAGVTWHRIKMPEHDYPQLANLRISRDQAHRLWVLSSANSREVVATTLARIGQNSHWATIHLADWYISDVKFLSPSEVVVCGFTGPKLNQRAVENSEGIVAFSSDHGKTWRIIYRTKEAPRINTVAVMGPDRLLAVGDKGWAFKVYRSSQIEKTTRKNTK